MAASFTLIHKAPPDQQGGIRKDTKGFRTRQHLVASARRAFRRAGYLSTTIADICAEAGKSTGVFYLYFKSKDDLLHALTEQFRAELPHTIPALKQPSTDPLEELRISVKSFWLAYKHHMDDFGGIFQAAMVDISFQQHLREIRAVGIQSVANRIRRMQAKGFCEGVDPILAGSALTGMVEFSCYNWLSRGIDFDRDSLDEDKAIETLTKLMMGAVSFRETAPHGGS